MMRKWMERGRERWAACWTEFRALPPGEQCFHGLFWTFFCYVVSFSWGYGVREVLPVIAAIFLAGRWRWSWQESNLRRLPLKWALVMFGCSLCWAVAVSSDPWASFIHVGRGINKQYVMFFVALEAVRGERELRRLVWAGAAALFLQGLNCLWQGSTGLDFIQGAPPKAGRLTGSFGDYWIGNYFALALLPVLGLWIVLRRVLGRAACMLLCAALLWPAMYGIIFSGVRNALLTLAAVLALSWLYAAAVRWRALSRMCAVLLLSGGLLLVLGLLSVRPDAFVGAADDGRWSLWRLGLAVFLDNPVCGAGAGQYNAAFRALGLMPLKDAVTISHPHNMYLQVLCETGIIGALLTLVPLGALAVWLERTLRPCLRRECAAALEGECGVHWRLTFFFALGFAAFCINGIVGHDFYRPWYQAMAFTHLGVALGAVLAGGSRDAGCR